MAIASARARTHNHRGGQASPLLSEAPSSVGQEPTTVAQGLNSRSVAALQDRLQIVQLLGWHICVLGAAMLIPWLVDLRGGDRQANGILEAAFLTMAAGLALVIVTWRKEIRGLGGQQAFLLTILVWTVLPAFGALPFVFGAPHADFTDAFFESMSGMTTTGSTVFSGLDSSPRGMLLWRAMLQWFGGLGIVIVAIVFLPAMRIGGMHFFRAAAFDLSGDIIPQTTRIATELLLLYLLLTTACMLAYASLGMSTFDAICHAMTTVSTGGYANYDASFAAFSPAAQYAAVAFMLLSGMPFLRLVRLMKGQPQPLLRDSQVHVFLVVVLAAAGLLAAWRLTTGSAPFEPTIRAALFNITSIVTTTGYATTDYSLWGGFAAALVFIVSLVGGCSASTSGAAKIFRFQILFKSLVAQLRHIHTPHGVFPLRYQGRNVEIGIVSSIMAFFFFYVLTLSCVAILLALLGLDTLTAITAPIATVTNVGPGLGPVIGPAGNFSSLPDAAKWLLSFSMLLGRLEFLSVLVLFTPLFWRG